MTRPNSVPESAGEIRVCIELKNSVVLQAAAAVTFTTAAGSAQRTYLELYNIAI